MEGFQVLRRETPKLCNSHVIHLPVVCKNLSI